MTTKMGRPRTNSAALPRYMVCIKGNYYFTKTKPFTPLGKVYSDALRKFMQLHDSGTLDPAEQNPLFGEVIDSYIANELPRKQPTTQASYLLALKLLRDGFGEMFIREITPRHVRQFFKLRAKSCLKGWTVEFAVMSAVFTYASEDLEVTDGNPCRQVKRRKIGNIDNARDREVLDHEFRAVYAVAPEWLRVLMDMAYLTGLRPGNLRKMKLADIKPDGLHVEIIKNRKDERPKKVIYTITDEMRSIINRAKAIKRDLKTPHLFTTNRGCPVNDNRLAAAMRRYCAHAIADGTLETPFQFRDIRAKVATYLNKTEGQEAATKQLQHSDPRITQKHYTRGATTLTPLKLITSGED